MEYFVCLKTITCGSLLYLSAFAGYAGLFCPLVPILFLSNRLYRYLSDSIFSYWQLYPTAVVQLFYKCKVEVYGDPIPIGQTSLLIMNHRTRTEWIFLWSVIYHCTEGSTRHKYPLKYIVKDCFRHIPGAGWIMQLSCFLHLRGEWSYDRNLMERSLSYFSEIKYKFTLCMFPEGVVQTPQYMKASNAYAEKHNLEKYDYLMHPKKTGFAFLVEQLLSRKHLDAVYDITSAFPDVIPQSEWVLLSGGFPKTIKFYIKRYPSSALPRSESELRTFLEERWSEKEKVLRKFYTAGEFPEGKLLKRSNKKELYTALIFWTFFPFVVLYLFYVYYWLKFIVFIHTVFLLYINYDYGYSFQEFELNVYESKKRTFGFAF